MYPRTGFSGNFNPLRHYLGGELRPVLPVSSEARTQVPRRKHFLASSTVFRALFRSHDSTSGFKTQHKAIISHGDAVWYDAT